MSRNKLVRFSEMATFSNVIQPNLKEITIESFKYKGKWREEVFEKPNPIVLELGCGKGEYTIGLAEWYPQKNFVGIDIKGSRMYVGAKKALAIPLKNVVFIRTKIELIEFIFDTHEVDEIWITFPDPQPKKRWTKKRLTSSWFQNRYINILKPNGILHLKTDNFFLYHYTIALLNFNKVDIQFASENIHAEKMAPKEISIHTYYEKQFLEKGQKITYLQWKNPGKKINELNEEIYQKIEEQYLRSDI